MDRLGWYHCPGLDSILVSWFIIMLKCQMLKTKVTERHGADTGSFQKAYMTTRGEVDKIHLASLTPKTQTTRVDLQKIPENCGIHRGAGHTSAYRIWFLWKPSAYWVPYKLHLSSSKCGLSVVFRYNLQSVDAAIFEITLADSGHSSRFQSCLFSLTFCMS